MRILVVGAGAIGGYFGGRMLAAGRDVTFLVRARREAELVRDGLIIRGPGGNLTLSDPPTVRAETLSTPFDLVVLSCKAYDLDDAIASFAPAVGPDTVILPLLNGMRHLDVLDAAFGAGRVLGGLCAIAATLDPQRAIVQMAPMHDFVFGERVGGMSERVRAILAQVEGIGFDARASEQILQDMWEKWVFLASLATSTCLMRGSVGDIVAAPGGGAVIRQLFAECAATAAANGYPPRDPMVARSTAMITAAGSALTASMFRDLQQGARIEADHIVGDLIARRDARGGKTAGLALLDVAYAHLKTYENRLGAN